MPRMQATHVSFNGHSHDPLGGENTTKKGWFNTRARCTSRMNTLQPPPIPLWANITVGSAQPKRHLFLKGRPKPNTQGQGWEFHLLNLVQWVFKMLSFWVWPVACYGKWSLLIVVAAMLKFGAVTTCKVPVGVLESWKSTPLVKLRQDLQLQSA